MKSLKYAWGIPVAAALLWLGTLAQGEKSKPSARTEWEKEVHSVVNTHGQQISALVENQRLLQKRIEQDANIVDAIDKLRLSLRDGNLKLSNALSRISNALSRQR